MFYQTKRTGVKTVARTKLISILSPEVLLSDAKRRDILQGIQTNLGFSLSKYQQLVQPIIHEVAIGCQLLPSTEHRFYALPGGLLDFLFIVLKQPFSFFDNLFYRLTLSSFQMSKPYGLMYYYRRLYYEVWG